MLTLYHDYTSPASAVAALRLQRLVDDGLPVTFIGFEALVAIPIPPPLEVSVAVDALAPTAVLEGLELRHPMRLPPTALAHVLGALAEAAGVGSSWRDRCYRGFWEQGVDLADPEVLAQLAFRSGLETAEVSGCLNDARRVTAFRRNLAVHRQLGVGGVPTLLAHGTLIPGLLPDEDLRALAG